METEAQQILVLVVLTALVLFLNLNAGYKWLKWVSFCVMLVLLAACFYTTAEWLLT